MANIKVKDADATNKFLAATGAGTDPDPFIPQHAITDGGGTISVDDGGGSLTVDNPALSVVGGGTEAAAQRVTLANDSTGVLSVDDNGASLTVDNPALSVVGGGTEAAAQRVTLANDSTGVLSVDDNGATLSVDDGGGTLTVDGSVTVADGGGSLTVDNPALAVVGGGAEAAALRVTIADDSTGVLAVNDDGGSLSVDDGGGTLTVDGSVTVADGGGSLTVDGSVAVTNAGTFATQVTGDALTALQLIDDPVKTDDAAFTPATDKVLMVGFEFDDASVDSVDEGDAGAARMSGNRNQYVQLRDGAGNERGANVNASGQLSVTVDNNPVLGAGTNNIGDVDVLSVVPGTGATNLGKAEDAGHNSGDVGVMALGVANEANTARAADGDYLPLATDTEGNVRVVGNRDHDAADAGEPVKIGAKAVSSLEGVTLVSANDRSDLYADLDGVLIVKQLTPFGDIITERVSNTDGASTALSNFGAGGSGIRNYVTTIAVFNSSSTDGFVDIRDGTGGSVFFTVPLPKTGGAVISFPVPLRQPTANTALAFDVSGALTTVYISLVGFQSKL